MTKILHEFILNSEFYFIPKGTNCKKDISKFEIIISKFEIIISKFEIIISKFEITLFQCGEKNFSTVRLEIVVGAVSHRTY